MSSSVYDFAIIGAGAAGGQLVLAMIDEPYFKDRRILLIDKDPKKVNDKTWCYWEAGEGKWDSLCLKTWSSGEFYTDDESQRFELEPYHYKMIRSMDFYQHMHDRVESASNVDWIEGEASTVLLDGALSITVNDKKFLANHLFDSRVHPKFYQEQDKYVRILQHFKGWIIECGDDVFDPDSFVMMDFRKPYKKQTAFTYLLPLSSKKALIEYTFFNEELVDDSVYEQEMHKYLSGRLGIDKYKVLDAEKGVIPMTNFPFDWENSVLVTKIGTGGGWVRPSTGYSFRKSQDYVQSIIQNLKKGEIPSEGILKKRFGLYDSLILEILARKNTLGPKVFGRLYARNPVKRILKFLDGNTHFVEELKVMLSVDSSLFLKALIHHLFR